MENGKTGEVVTLRGDKLPPPDEGDPAVIKCLEYWLEAARSGGVIGIALAASWRDGTVGTSWHGQGSPKMVGRLFGLMHDITTKLDE